MVRSYKGLKRLFPSCLEGWRDDFFVDDNLRITVVPSARQFVSVFEVLSKGLSESQLRCLRELGKAMILLEAEGDLDGLIPLWKQTLEILIEAESEISSEVPNFLPKFVWAITYLIVSLSLSVLRRYKDVVMTEMEDMIGWLTILDCLWPDDGGCRKTKRALKMHRRLTLNQCGRFAEAVAGANDQDLRCILNLDEWRDSFPFVPSSESTATPLPSPAQFKYVLHSLARGFRVSQTERVLSLAEKLSDFQEEDEAGILPLCEEMITILIEVVEGGELDLMVPGFLPRFTWAFTWLKLHLLFNDMLMPGADSKETMELFATWFTLLSCLWPDDGSCPNTKHGLDMHRRLLLFECGHHTEALAGYQSSDPTWAGFEKCVILRSICDKQAGLNHYDKALDWLRQAEKAANELKASKVQQWPYIDLRLTQMEMAFLQRARWKKDKDDCAVKYLSKARRVDLQLRFDGSQLDAAKIELLTTQAEILYMSRLGTGRHSLKGLKVLPELTQEITIRIHPRDVASYLFVRGLQLFIFDHFEDAVKELKGCLNKISGLSKSEWHGTQLAEMESWCRASLRLALCQLSRDEWDFYRFLEHIRLTPAPLQCGAEDTIVWDRCIRGYSKWSACLQLLEPTSSSNQPTEAVLDGLRYLAYGTLLEPASSSDRPREYVAYWESWEEYCGLMRSLTQRMAYNLRNRKVASRDYSLSPAHTETWVLMASCYAYHIFKLHLTWPPPHNHDHANGSGSTFLQVYVDDLARRVLVYSERVLPHSVLSHLLQPDDQLQTIMDEEADWNIIRQAHETCGPDTVFLEYCGWNPGYDYVSIVHNDGTNSCLYFREERESAAAAQFIALDVVSTMDHSKELVDRQVKGLEKLYDLLIRPVFDHLRARNQAMSWNHKLVIVATGWLAHVPFTILRNKDTHEFLFQEVTLSMTPSFRLLHQCHKRYEDLQRRPLFGPGPGAAVALGNPYYLPDGETVPLPGSGKEVEGICNLFKDSGCSHQVQKLLDQEATVERFLEWTLTKTMADRAIKYTQAFIHIASHNLVDQDNPRGTLGLAFNIAGRAQAGPSHVRGQGGSSKRTSIGYHEPMVGDHEQQEVPIEPVFSKATTSWLEAMLREENLLRAATTLDSREGSLPSHWILSSNKEWSASMVVLSACNTANGQLERDGSLNLGRAFMLQGIPSTVVSLWSLDDTTTGHLMFKFYKKMMEGEDICSALRWAMVSMLNEGYPLWQVAPFVVNGIPNVRLPPEMRQHRHNLY